MEDSACGRAESEDKTSVTDLLLVQKYYVTDTGPQLTSFGPKMLRHGDDLVFTQYLFLDKHKNGFGICSTVIFVQFFAFCREHRKLALIKKEGLTLAMAAEHRTKGNIWEALFCRILYLSLSTFL